MTPLYLNIQCRLGTYEFEDTCLILQCMKTTWYQKMISVGLLKKEINAWSREYYETKALKMKTFFIKIMFFFLHNLNVTYPLLQFIPLRAKFLLIGSQTYLQNICEIPPLSTLIWSLNSISMRMIKRLNFKPTIVFMQECCKEKRVCLFC